VLDKVERIISENGPLIYQTLPAALAGLLGKAEANTGLLGESRCCCRCRRRGWGASLTAHAWHVLLGTPRLLLATGPRLSLTLNLCPHAAAAGWQLQTPIFLTPGRTSFSLRRGRSVRSWWVGGWVGAWAGGRAGDAGG
jgi:hypothetical protein